MAFLGRGNGSEHKGGCTRVDNGKYMKQGLQRLGTGSPKTYKISGRIPPGSKETKQVGHWMLWRYGKSNPGAPLSHWTLLWCSLLKWIRSRLEVGSHCSHKSLRSCQIVWSFPQCDFMFFFLNDLTFLHFTQTPLILFYLHSTSYKMQSN